MSVVTLQPDETAGIDTFITPRGTPTNFGNSLILIVGELNDDVGSAGDRTLIKFDLSSIPATAVITSAVLSLMATEDHATNAQTFRVYRQKRAWVESQATWSIFSTGNSWQTAGGFGANDCEQTEIGSRAFTATETLNVFKDFTLDSAKVQEWVSGAFSNNGVLIKADTGTNDGYYFASSGHATAANRPKLAIVYTVVGPLIGLSSGSSTVTGTLRAKGNLRGTSSGSSTASGTLKANGNLRAETSGDATVSGTLRAEGNLRGSVAGTSTAVARPSGDTGLAGSAEATSTAIATLRALGKLSGNSQGTTVIIGAIMVLGYLRATVGGVSTVSGTLLQPAIVGLPVQSYRGMYRSTFKGLK